MGLACSETALGQFFHFGVRAVEIMETFETNLETCFSNRSYACTDLESIWYGRQERIFIISLRGVWKNYGGVIFSPDNGLARVNYSPISQLKMQIK